MKFFILIQLIALIGLSTQYHTWSFEETFQYPIKAVSVLRGGYKDSVTGELRHIRGVVRFVQESAKSDVAVSVDIRGFSEHDGKKIVKRGLHIHQFAISDLSDNITAVCGSTGPHFNPTNMTHGLLNSPVRHFGDLGNMIVNRDGTVKVDFVNDKLVLYGVHSIIGRSIVLHAGEDDGGLKDTDASRGFGTSGPRIACGIIGIEQSEYKTSSRNLLNVLTGDYLPITRYISLEQDEADNSNSTAVDGNKVNSGIDFDDLDELSKSLPQAVPMFKLFYGILKNVVDATRDSNSQIMSFLSQFPANSNVPVTTMPTSIETTLQTPIETTLQTPIEKEMPTTVETTMQKLVQTFNPEPRNDTVVDKPAY